MNEDTLYNGEQFYLPRRFKSGRYRIKGPRYYLRNGRDRNSFSYRQSRKHNCLKRRRERPIAVENDNFTSPLNDDNLHGISSYQLDFIIDELHASGTFQAEACCLELCSAFNCCSIEFRDQAIAHGVLRKIALHLSCPSTRGVFRAAVWAIAGFCSGIVKENEKTWPMPFQAQPAMVALSQIVLSANITSGKGKLENYYFKSDINHVDEVLLTCICCALGSLLICGGCLSRSACDLRLGPGLLKFAVSNEVSSMLRVAALEALAGAAYGGDPLTLNMMGVDIACSNQLKMSAQCFPIIDAVESLLTHSAVDIRRKSCEVLNAAVNIAPQQFVEVLLCRESLLILIMKQMSGSHGNSKDDDRKEASNVMLSILQYGKGDNLQHAMKAGLLTITSQLFDTKDEKLVDIALSSMELLVGNNHSRISSPPFSTVLLESCSLQQLLIVHCSGDGPNSLRAASLLNAVASGPVCLN